MKSKSKLKWVTTVPSKSPIKWLMLMTFISNKYQIKKIKAFSKVILLMIKYHQCQFVCQNCFKWNREHYLLLQKANMIINIIDFANWTTVRVKEFYHKKSINGGPKCRCKQKKTCVYHGSCNPPNITYLETDLHDNQKSCLYEVQNQSKSIENFNFNKQ